MQTGVPTTTIAHATVARIDVGELTLGQMAVDRLIVSDASVGITAGQALLPDVTVTVRLDFQLVWSIRVQRSRRRRAILHLDEPPER